MKKTLTVLFTLAFVLISVKSFTYRSGPSGGLTNAPGEGHCATSCHTGTSLNGGSGSTSNMKLEDDFTGGGYIPDSTYTMTLKYSQSSISRWGFNLTALVASDNSPAGDFTITSNRTQKRTKTISGKTRSYVEHTSTGSASVGTNATEWEFEWTAPSSNVGTINFYAVVNAANGNGTTSGDQIYAKVFTVSPSSRLPEATAAAKDSTVCSGEVVSLIGSATSSPTQYSWTFPGGSPSVSTDQNPKTSYSGFGKKLAILRAKNAKGWGDYDTLEITVERSPTAFISGAATRTICPGDSVELIAQFNATYQYKWSTGETGNRIFAKKAGDYFVNVSAANCAKTSNTIKVEEFNTPKPSLSASNTNDSICKMAGVVLTAGGTYDSLVWYDNEMEIGKSTKTTFGVNVDSGSVYQVRGWTTDGCLSPYSDTVQYTVVAKDPAPTVSCVDREPFSVSFEWSGVVGHTGVEISEDGGKIWKKPSSGTTGKVHKLTGLDPEEDYEVWVRAFSDAPCFYSEIAKATCATGKCSPLTASIVADTAVCNGEEVNVEINGLRDENYSLSFNGGGSFTDTVFQFSPQNTADYIIEVLDSTFLGCPAKKLEFSVRVDNIGNLRFRTQKSSNTFCSTDTVIFTGASGNDEYRFYVNNVLRSTQQDSFYLEDQFANGDSAWVEASKGACDAISTKVYISVTPLPDATFTYSNVGSMYTFEPTDKNNKSYFWTFGDGQTSVVMKPDHSYKSSENSTITAELDVVDNNDCPASTSQSIDIPDFSSVEELQKLGLRMYPSPATDKLFVEWDHPVSAPTTIKVTTTGGENVVMFTEEGTDFTIDLTNIAVGIYVIEISNDEVITRQRLIKI